MLSENVKVSLARRQVSVALAIVSRGPTSLVWEVGVLRHQSTEDLVTRQTTKIGAGDRESGGGR